MKKQTIEEKYKKLYKDLNFERAGLFRLLRDMLGSGNVVYPGSGIHITPSFYFRSVTYVDSRDEVEEFFSDPSLIRSVIDSEKNYREVPEIRFFQKDYLLPDFQIEGEFQLLLCLHAPYCFPNFRKNLPVGAHYLTNDFQGSARSALDCGDLKLKHRIRYSPKGYRILNDEIESESKNSDKKKKSSGLNRKNDGMEISDRDDYFLFSVI
ncbi:hypothetical protein CH371_03785 [Leptospira wolffii]|uniref:Uncharacterized protein n=1 Tax=Leptospira wolffii TaxID=409998 RepID=A0A2M9ZFH8_9LEPT|nr:hypothetical protein [Leptospira wolffii]PJZ67190.1 hypothetical protein CH371_03785 [Leptospira wolffii]